MQFSSRSSHREPVEINVTSLVDIIFNLLLFFMLTTSFSETAGIEVELPSATAADKNVDPNDLVIALLEDGATLVRGQSVTPDELDTMVKTLKETDASTTVVVQADGAVPHARVVEVIDLAKKHGLRSVSIATQGN